MAAAVGVAVITTGLLVGGLTWAATAASAKQKYKTAAEAAAAEAEAEAAELKANAEQAAADAQRAREAATKLSASVPIGQYIAHTGIKQCPDCKLSFLDPSYTVPTELKPCYGTAKSTDPGQNAMRMIKCGLAHPKFKTDFETELESYLKCAGEVCGRDFRASVGETEWACLAKKCAKARQEENFFGVGNIELLPF